MGIMNIQEFVKNTLDNNSLGADGTCIYTNVFNKAECIKMPHRWGKDNTPEKFTQFCKDGRNKIYSTEWAALYIQYVMSLRNKVSKAEISFALLDALVCTTIKEDK